MKLEKANPLRKSIKPYLYILPMVIIFGVFSVYPMLRTIFLSFMDTNATATEMSFIGFQNYATMLADKRLPRIVSNTLIYGFAQVVLNILIGLLLAAVANSKSMRFRTLFRVATFYPYIFR